MGSHGHVCPGVGGLCKPGSDALMEVLANVDVIDCLETSHLSHATNKSHERNPQSEGLSHSIP